MFVDCVGIIWRVRPSDSQMTVSADFRSANDDKRFCRYYYARHRHRSIWHGGHVPPTFSNGWARGSSVSRSTATKKLTKLYWPSRKRSPKRLIVLLKPKKWKGTTKKFGALIAPDVCPLPYFEIRSGATDARNWFVSNNCALLTPRPCFEISNPTLQTTLSEFWTTAYAE